MVTVGFQSDVAGSGGAESPRRAERLAMVRTQLAARDIVEPRVLAAMAEVPRHEFVAPSQQARAYEDCPLPIGHGQTISQPYIVALMIQLLAPPEHGRVLEIGTGCGYQAAVLARLAAEVCTVEIVEPLARTAEATLRRLGVTNVTVRAGDGRAGWRERAPFAGIVVAAAGRQTELAWGEQLAPGGRLVAPLGGRGEQWLHVFTKGPAGLRDETLIPVRFVPLTGRQGEQGRGADIAS